MTKLSLPSIPKSKIYNSDNEMNVEWQDFFFNLYKRVGGYSGEPWPIDSIFIGAENTDPSKLVGYGTWDYIGTDTVAGLTVYVWRRTK